MSENIIYLSEQLCYNKYCTILILILKTKSKYCIFSKLVFKLLNTYDILGLQILNYLSNIVSYVKCELLRVISENGNSKDVVTSCGELHFFRPQHLYFRFSDFQPYFCHFEKKQHTSTVRKNKIICLFLCLDGNEEDIYSSEEDEQDLNTGDIWHPKTSYDDYKKRILKELNLDDDT